MIRDNRSNESTVLQTDDLYNSLKPHGLSSWAVFILSHIIENNKAALEDENSSLIIISRYRDPNEVKKEIICMNFEPRIHWRVKELCWVSKAVTNIDGHPYNICEKYDHGVI